MESEHFRCFGCAQVNNISVDGATLKEQVDEIQENLISSKCSGPKKLCIEVSDFCSTLLPDMSSLKIIKLLYNL